MTTAIQKYDKWVEATRSFWDAESDFTAKYRRICSSPEFDAAEDEETLRRLWNIETQQSMAMITDSIPIKPEWTCVEIGSGIGRLLKPFANMCERAIGYDISENMVTFSREYLADTPNAEVRHNNGCSLPGLESSSVDFVYSHLAFQHLTLFEVVDAYLAEIARVLKPNGYVRIQNWRDEHIPIKEKAKNVLRPLLGRGTYKSSRCWVWDEGKNVQFGGVTFTPGAWKNTLNRHGLRVESMETGRGHDYWMWVTAVRR